MSLDQYDMSLDDGRPVYLYEFSLGALKWRYASSATDVGTRDPSNPPAYMTWAACAISHDAVKETGDATVDALTIEATIDIAPAQIYLTSPPLTPLLVRIYQKDVSDLEIYSMYSGEISQVNVPDIGKIVITCETIGVSLNRMGLRGGWQRSCPHTLYGPACRLNKAAHGVSCVISAIYGITVGMTTAIGGTNFSGGILEYTHPVKGVQAVMIETQVGPTDIALFGSTQELQVGMTVNLFPGCSHTPHDCQAFGNYNNYGGVPSLPGKSPFDGSNPFY